MQPLSKGWCQIQPHCKQRQQLPSPQHSLDPCIRKHVGMPQTSQATEPTSVQCPVKWPWQTQVTYFLQQKKPGTSFSWHHSHIHQSKRLVEPQSMEQEVTEQLLNCFPLLSRCPWEQPSNLLLAISKPQATQSVQFQSNACVVLGVVRGLLVVVVVFMVGFFGWLGIFGYFLIFKQTLTTHIGAEGHALQSEPCLHRAQGFSDANHPDVGGTRQLPASTRTPAEASHTNPSSFQLHSAQEMSCDNSYHFYIRISPLFSHLVQTGTASPFSSQRL